MRIVELVLDEDQEMTGIEAISIVENPAIEADFVALKADEIKLAEINKDKKILMGALLIPNKPIFRNSEDQDDYYIYFYSSLNFMEYKKRKKAILLLSDGTMFYGKSVSGEGTAFGEVCFNTGMTGYQEIYTDPSYFGQLMIMTNPHIGNYGVVNDESESDSVKISGLICKNFSYNYSRELADCSLEEFLNKNNLFAISDIDTRALVSYIRDNGAMNALITTDVNDIDSLSKKLAEVPSMEGLELASKVSTKSTYYYGNEDSKFKVAALDLGIKKNIF